MILIAEATVLLEGEEGFDGGGVGALVRGFVAEIQSHGVVVGATFERFSLQIAGAASEPEGVDDFANAFAFGAGHGNELLIELEDEPVVGGGVLAREEAHGFAGGPGEAVLDGVVRGAGFSFRDCEAPCFGRARVGIGVGVACGGCGMQERRMWRVHIARAHISSRTTAEERPVRCFYSDAIFL